MRKYALIFAFAVILLMSAALGSALNPSIEPSKVPSFKVMTPGAGVNGSGGVSAWDYKFSQLQNKISKLETKTARLEAQNKVLLALMSRQAVLLAKSSGESGLDAQTQTKMDQMSDAASSYIDDMIGGDVLGGIFSDMARGIEGMLSGVAGGNKETLWEAIGILHKKYSGESSDSEKKGKKKKKKEEKSGSSGIVGKQTPIVGPGVAGNARNVRAGVATSSSGSWFSRLFSWR